MRGRAHVRVDTAVGAVGPPASAGGLVDLDVRDEEHVGVETLELGVGLGVLEQVEQELARLLGPPGLPNLVTLVLGLGSTANAAVEACEGDSALVVQDGLQVLTGLDQVLAANGSSGLTRVLEVHAQVRATGLIDREGAGKRNNTFSASLALN